MHDSRSRRVAAQFGLSAFLSSAAGLAVAAASNNDTSVLEEVIVTATLRESALQSTPLSVSAITGETLEQMGAAQLSDFYRTIPGLSLMDRGPNQKKFTIRGIQNDVVTGGNTVGVYIDDIPVSLSASQVDLNVFDLDRVEILRGPQGTLYGASSMAGTIKYITRKPDLSAFASTVRAELSTTHEGGNSYSIEGMLNLPLLQDRLGLRLVGYHREYDGYIDKTYPGEVVPAFPGVPADGFFPGSPPVRGHGAYSVPAILSKDANEHEIDGLRTSLRLRANDDLTITATLLYEDSHVADSFAHQPDDVGDLQNAVPIRQPQDNENLLANLTVEYSLGAASLFSTTNYFDSDTQNNELFTNVFPADLTPGGTELLNTIGSQVFMQEVRLSSNNDSRWQWLGGAWFYDEETRFRQQLHVQFDRSLPVVDETTPVDNRQWALFGELSYALTDELTATAGVRYWDVSQSFGPKVVDIDPEIFFLSPRGVQPDVFAFEDTVTTWKFNLSYQANDDLLVYLQAAQGFRVGGFNGNPTNDPNVPERYDSDSLWNYEFGTKASFLGGRLIVNPTIYHVDWSDIQTRVFVNGAGFNGNAGKAHITGVELELTALATAQLTLSIAASALEAQLDEDEPINELFPTGVEGRKGDRLPGVPEVTFSAAAQYDFPITSSLEGSVRMDVSHTGNSFTEFRAAPPAPPGQYDELDAYTVANLRGTVSSDNWDLTLYVDNVFDERAEVDILRFLGQIPKVTTNRPRTLGVRLQHRF
jgi:iron complex outermembrane recepter protein